MERAHFAFGLIALFGAPAIANAELVTVTYQATASTVVGTPFGVEVPRETPVSGYFMFNTATADEEPFDLELGDYRHQGDSAFLASFLGHELVGSSTAVYKFKTVSDYCNIEDGPGTFGDGGGVMSFNGNENEEIELWFSASPGEIDVDTFFNPFPFFNFGFLGTPHTFVIEDANGRILMQIESVETLTSSTTTTTMPPNDCGDPTGSGVTATDALVILNAGVGAGSCEVCVCDADGNGLVTATDALRVLMIATGQELALNCPAC